MVGVKWGRLEVIAPAERPEGNEVKIRGTWWLCRCRCGQERVLPRQYITQRTIKSCGCAKRRTRQDAMPADTKDDEKKIAAKPPAKKKTLKTAEQVTADKAKAGRARAEQIKGKCSKFRMPMGVSKQDRKCLNSLLDICKCARCKKTFEKMSSEWKYQDKDKNGRNRYYCSWHCYRGDEPDVKPKMSLTERARLQSINAI